VFGADNPDNDSRSKGQISRRLEAFLSILFEAMADDPLNPRRDCPIRLRQVRGIFLEDRTHRVGSCRALERALAGHHLIEHRAEREDVRAVIGLETAHLLGRHVANRAEDDARDRLRGVVGSALMPASPGSDCVSFAKPKSRIFKRPSLVTKMFSGVRSR
jgi:hypothetical protein